MSVFPSWVDNLPTLSNGFKWMPGVPGGIPEGTLDTTLTSGQMTTSGINNALAAASGRGSPSNIRVVQMPAGSFTGLGTIVPQDYTILRGAGGDPATGTRLVLNAGAQIASGVPTWPATTNISGSLAIGATTAVVASASTFAVGDIVQIDQIDDLSYVAILDAVYSKRTPWWNNSGPTSSGGLRSVTSLHEITNINGTTITFDPPVRIAYDAAFTPQMWRVARRGTSGLWYAGLEDFYLTGPQPDDNAIGFNAGAFCWVKGVQTDGSTANGATGINNDHITFAHQFRSTIEGCYCHHSLAGLQSGGASYGININVSSSDCLVIDCISVYFCKGIQSNCCGPGNVIAYCYADNTSANGGPWMDGAISASHQSYSHNMLFEGCYGSNLACDSTHGSSGRVLFYRSYGHGQARDITQSSFLRAANVDGWSREAAYVGCVLNAPGGAVYEVNGCTNDSAGLSGGAIFRVGQCVWGEGDWNELRLTKDNPTPHSTRPPANNAVGSDGDGRQATYTTRCQELLYRHGNWNSVNATVLWDGGNADHSLPSSAFITSKPGFFGDLPWPPINPEGSTTALRNQGVPAQVRYDSGTPMTPLESSGAGGVPVSTVLALAAGEHVVRVRVASGSPATLAPLEVTAATVALAGAVAGAGSVVGAVTHAVPLAAQAAGIGAAMAEFLGLSGLAGVLAGLGTPAAGLALAKLLTGTAASQATATGEATNTRWVAGAAAGATDLTAGLSVGTGMMGAFQGAATPGADLALTKPLGAGAAGAASPAAALALVKALVGTAAGAVSLTGLITGAGELIGWGMAGASSAEGALSVTVNLVSSPTWARALGIADLSGGSSLAPYTLTGVIVAAGLPGFVVPATHAPVTLEG